MDSQTTTKKIEQLIQKREMARLLHGGCENNKEYDKFHNQIKELRRTGKKLQSKNRSQYEKKTTSEGKPIPQQYKKSNDDHHSTENIHRDFDLNKDAYANYSQYPIEEYTTKSVSTYAGHVINEIRLPSLQDDEVRSITRPKSKIVEVGRLEVTAYDDKNKKLPNNIKDFVIHMIGKGFGRIGKRIPFAFIDAKVTHGLLYEEKDTVVALVEYIYEDPTTHKIMKATIGAGILSPVVLKKRHSNGTTTAMYAKSCLTYNLAQYSVLEEYNRRGLGGISLKMIEGAMMASPYNADLLVWCACFKSFYDMCGCTNNPKWLDCPFKVEGDEEKDRDMFYYSQLPSGNKNFKKSIVDFVDKDPSNRKISIHFKCPLLDRYYGNVPPPSIPESSLSTTSSAVVSKPELSSTTSSAVVLKSKSESESSSTSTTSTTSSTVVVSESTPTSPLEPIVEHPKVVSQRVGPNFYLHYHLHGYKESDIETSYNSREVVVSGHRFDTMGKKYRFSRSLDVSRFPISKCSVYTDGFVKKGVFQIAIEFPLKK